jgi:hypothetical protein
VLIGYDRELCALVVDTVVRELQRCYRWRAKRLLGLSSVEEAFTGTVTVIQRFDLTLRLNIYDHVIDPISGYGGVVPIVNQVRLACTTDRR